MRSLYIGLIKDFGGSGEIRTHGEIPPSSVFKTDALNRSATLPIGLSDRTRTCDPRLRRPMLCPTELQTEIGLDSKTRTCNLMLPKHVLYLLSYTQIGAFDRTRTYNLLITNQLHYQLCYEGYNSTTSIAASILKKNFFNADNSSSDSPIASFKEL